MHETIDKEFGNKDLYITGFADVRGLLIDQYRGFHYALAIARRLDDTIIDEIKNGPTQRYYSLYRLINDELSAKITAVSDYLTKAGIDNVPIKPTFEDQDLEREYYDTLRTPFSHKLAATRAGIGWIGKTDLLITHAFGPRVRLATILLEHNHRAFELGTPITASACGSCAVCVEACPAQAANGKPWDTTIDRDEFYNAFKCREKCRELSKKNMNIENSICGICVSVCPMGNRFTTHTDIERG
jgi:epoxyqueuosine reductase